MSLNKKAAFTDTGINWTSKNMTLSTATTHDTPDKLNFVAHLNLKFTLGSTEYECPNVYIGQGHNWGGNNWWVFTNQTGSTALSCTTYNGMFGTNINKSLKVSRSLASDNNENRFSISAIN